MKILFWLPGGIWSEAIGGVESLAKTLAIGLYQKGYQVSVLSFDLVEHVARTQTAHFQNEPEYIDGIEHYRFNHAQLSQAQHLASLKRLYQVFKNINPDILHIHYTVNSNLIYYLFLTKYIKCPQVMTTHGLLCEEHFPMYKKISEKMDKIICVSKYLSQASDQITTQNSITIHNGLNATEIDFIPHTQTEAVRFLCLGRLTYEKGYDLAIQAFCKISKQFPSAELYIVGDGCEKETLQSLAADNQNIYFEGALDHQQSLNFIQSIHVVLVPSRYESFGLVAIEAGLMGRPVIATRVGGLVEIVRDNNGLLVESEDIDALADAMQFFIDHRDTIHSIGKSGFEWVRSQFSSEKMINQYMTQYQNL